MSADRPNRDDIAQGMTVKIVRDEENGSDQTLIGDVRQIRTDERSHPSGIEVELESGATGRVTEIHPDEA